MKQLALSAFVVLLLCPVLFSHTYAVAPGPDETVRRFYVWYLHRLNVDDLNPLKNRTVALQFLTPEFLRRVPRLVRQMDADVIICAQDFDPAWEKNVRVDTPKIKGNRATSSMQLDGREVGSVKLNVTLKRISSGWRIDAVECGE